MNSELKDVVVDHYKELVFQKYPQMAKGWPVLCGYSTTTFTCENWYFIVFHHTGYSGMMTFNGEGDKDPSIFGVDSVTETNINKVKVSARNIYAKSDKDLVFSFEIKSRNENQMQIDLSRMDIELSESLQWHEMLLGLSKMKIFLSHKSKDKTVVRNYANTLKELGFLTWFDEDDAHAGSDRNRIFSSGMEESCAAIFFITENFKDEKDIGEEIDFALYQKRERGDNFSIIMLCFKNGHVPDILKQRFIYKEPDSDLEALREIIRALPIKVGRVEFKR